MSGTALIVAEAIAIFAQLIMIRARTEGMTEEQVVEEFKKQVSRLKVKDPNLLPDV